MSIKLSLEELCKITDGEILNKKEKNFEGVSIDTRSLKENQLFIALKGKKAHGNDFLKEAFLKKASICLTDQKIETDEFHGSIILVKNSEKALRDLAFYHRKKIKAQFIGITGSVGKTTTKSFTKQILEKSFKTNSSDKSFNNHLGLPLSILKASLDTEKLICEIGISHPEDMDPLLELASPDIALVTEIGPSHLGNFKNIEELSKNKGKIYESKKNQINVFNLDNPYTFKMSQKNTSSQITYSLKDKKADVFFKLVKEDKDFMEISGHIRDFNFKKKVYFYGSYNLQNLIAAVSLCLAAKMHPQKIIDEISQVKLQEWGRAQRIKLKKGEMIFDAYNANPMSMQASLDELKKMSKNKVLILGQMLELGEKSKDFHFELGKKAASLKPELIWFIGGFQNSFKEGLKHADFKKKLYLSDIYEQSLAKKIKNMLTLDMIVLVKASRSLNLEKVADVLKS